MKKQNNQGITLIALVITIIVLLILAGVSLRLVAGDEGILGRAEKAVSKNNTSSLKEEIELAISEARIAYYEGDIVDGATSASENIIKTLEKGIETSQGPVQKDKNSATLSLTDEQNNTTEIGSYDAENGLTMKSEDGKVYLNPNEWEYRIDESTQTATLTQYKNPKRESTVVVPNYIKTDDGDIKITTLSSSYSIWSPLICNVNQYEGYGRYPDYVTRVVVSEGIEVISGDVFSGTKSLVEITLPVSLKRIGYYSFGYCSGLTTINYGGNASQWSEIEIGDFNSEINNATKNFNQ